MAPPSSAGQTSMPSPTIWNGPSGEVAVATPMHWYAGSKLVVVGYMTNWPGPNWLTSGAHVFPGITHLGSSGSASSSDISHVSRSVEVATWTLRVAVLVA